MSAPVNCSISSPKARSPKPGLRTNINIGIQYLGAWLAGTGCVPIFNLMEDAATAEISRAQIWHWIRSPGRAGRRPQGHSVLVQEIAGRRTAEGQRRGAEGKLDQGAQLFERLTTDDQYVEFITLPAYELID